GCGPGFRSDSSQAPPRSAQFASPRPTWFRVGSALGAPRWGARSQCCERAPRAAAAAGLPRRRPLARRVLLHGPGGNDMEIRRILVPVDFSDHSQSALETAIGLARTFGAQLHLLHCYQIQPTAMAPYGIVVPETFEHDIRMAA